MTRNPPRSRSRPDDPASGQPLPRPLRRLARWFGVPAALFAAVTFAQSPTRDVKSVEIDKTRQVLRAFEGSRVVLETRVSTGRWNGSTPNGTFHAGEKMRMHYSQRYHHAPMPFSVQVTGHVFIHGFTEVPAWPASHGCIRVPLDGRNPAKQLFEWITPGTPIHIVGAWRGPPP